MGQGTSQSSLPLGSAFPAAGLSMARKAGEPLGDGARLVEVGPGGAPLMSHPLLVAVLFPLLPACRLVNQLCLPILPLGS